MESDCVKHPSGILVSPKGFVYLWDRRGKGRWKKTYGWKDHGYRRVSSLYKKYYVHNLVAECFIPNPKKHKRIHHKNGNQADNRVENLAWIGCAEHGSLHLTKEGHNGLTQEDAEEIRKLYAEGKKKQYQIAAQFGVSQGTISRIVNHKVWKPRP